MQAIVTVGTVITGAFVLAMFFAGLAPQEASNIASWSSRIVLGLGMLLAFSTSLSMISSQFRKDDPKQGRNLFFLKLALAFGGFIGGATLLAKFIPDYVEETAKVARDTVSEARAREDATRVEWDKFVADHQCKVVEKRDPVKTGLFTSSDPQTGWRCNDGVLYWKND
ncbi:hypothetical protein [Diaphorobacter caeni]|uniref:hypothetical protein n=1 Tax=Diaphorobacter caeni TaxID=2784387 RepID=UPI0018900EB6|nr:hypothetical protein [Diaphorobacter caeni]MBF5007799.1 hypothetical protein [Diaphorobacter caeni]